MLVLSRKKDETIVIPALGIEFRLLEVRGDKVRVGVVAPKNVDVWRNEVWKRLQAIAEQDAENDTERLTA